MRIMTFKIMAFGKPVAFAMKQGDVGGVCM